MLKPSTANQPIIRFLALAAVVAAAARSTEFLPAAGIGFVHVLAYGTWLGTLVRARSVHMNQMCAWTAAHLRTQHASSDPSFFAPNQS